MIDVDQLSLWESLILTAWPGLEKHHYYILQGFADSQWLFAVNDWGQGKDTELARLYEQYRVLKALTGKT